MAESTIETKTSQTFKVIQMTGKIDEVSLSILGGCNIHERISDFINNNVTEPFDQNDLSKKRQFHVVYGNERLDSLWETIFADNAQQLDNYDDLFDQYYIQTFVAAESENRSLKGKEFSQQAFEGAPPIMSVHVTMALS
jgi:hypothetical protein